MDLGAGLSSRSCKHQSNPTYPSRTIGVLCVLSYCLTCFAAVTDHTQPCFQGSLLTSTAASALTAFTSITCLHSTIGFHGLHKTTHMILGLLYSAPHKLL